MKRKKLSKRAIALICVVLIVGTVAVLELTNTTRFLHHKKEALVASGSSFATKGEKKASGKSASDKQGRSGGGAGTSAQSSTLSLYVPSGNFVSNHHPNLSGSPAPNTIASVCNTTPGASCKIVFSKDGVTKELPSQVTDANGSAYWTWKLQDIGLTAGSWKIQAIASLNGQTKDASDALDMVVAE